MPQKLMEATDRALLLSCSPCLAAVDALQAAKPKNQGADASTLAAVPEHLPQCHGNPRGFDTTHFPNRMLSGQAVP
ncbi:hypothetical protein [Streptomyces sp. NPDC048248]|uniref:hypothetical protein n=1 Tax=Streptomyces sp. NPDC048248 TaxID=3365523 RepID=UPI003712145E